VRGGEGGGSFSDLHWVFFLDNDESYVLNVMLYFMISALFVSHRSNAEWVTGKVTGPFLIVLASPWPKLTHFRRLSHKLTDAMCKRKGGEKFPAKSSIVSFPVRTHAPILID
jgi:hypothetical protein